MYTSVVAMIGIISATLSLVALQPQPLHWAADDGKPVAALEKDGSKLEGEHVTLWFRCARENSSSRRLRTLLGAQSRCTKLADIVRRRRGE